jgi:hypothetical protein
MTSKTYTESLIEVLKDKIVEIYVGQQHEQTTYTDNAVNINSVICGRIVGGSGDCLIVDAYYIDHSDKLIKGGNLLYLNGYNIVSVSELNGKGSFRDAAVSVEKASRIGKALLSNESE